MFKIIRWMSSWRRATSATVNKINLRAEATEYNRESWLRSYASCKSPETQDEEKA